MYDFDLHISKVVFPRFFKIICRREWQCFSVPNYSSINVLWSQKSRNNSNPATCWAVLWTSDTFKKLPVFRRKKKRRKKNSIQHKISFKNCPITNICKTRRVSQFILGLTWMRMSVCVRTAWQVVSPHQQNLATLPAPPPTPRFSFSSLRAQCPCVSQVICWHGSWHIIVTLRVFFLLPPSHLLFCLLFAFFFFFSWNKETNTEKLFGIFNCIKTFFYFLFKIKELCDFSS